MWKNNEEIEQTTNQSINIQLHQLNQTRKLTNRNHKFSIVHIIWPWPNSKKPSPKRGFPPLKQDVKMFHDFPWFSTINHPSWESMGIPHWNKHVTTPNSPLFPRPATASPPNAPRCRAWPGPARRSPRRAAAARNDSKKASRSRSLRRPGPSIGNLGTPRTVRFMGCYI